KETTAKETAPKAEPAAESKPARPAKPAKPQQSEKPAPAKQPQQPAAAAPTAPAKEQSAPAKEQPAAPAEPKLTPTKVAPSAPGGAAVLGRLDLTPKRPKKQEQRQRPQQNQGQQQGQRKPQPQQQSKPAAPAAESAAPAPARPAAKLPERQPKPERQPRPKKPEAPKAKRPEMTTIRPHSNAPVDSSVIIQQGPEATASESAVKRRVVDTRGSHIEMDRYNSRYDDMAHEKSGRAAENSSSKQKLTQKSQQYRQKGKGGKQGRRETEKEREDRIARERRLKPVSIVIPDEITVSELAMRLKMTAAEVIKKLMMMGTMASLNDVIDFDTAYLVATELGAKAEREVVVTIEERIIDDSDDDDTQLVPRSPVVVVMGHVDHGKTSLLDYIRKTNVTSGEAGGITQHIGAYRVTVDDREITFLDTPGHAAFTTMRARGAQVTDIAVLVVAADDGIMPQTVEAINHAKAAGVSIIVAINKMDKPGTTTDNIMQQLTEYELVPEEWGGDIICVPISAKTGMGIPDLLENLILLADMRELRANPNRAAKGTVIEARLDKGRGPIATVLVQNGTLHDHDIIVAGTAVGRVRAMTDDRGTPVKSAGPSIPVEIIGLDSVPSGGDIFNAVSDERLARELVEQRRAAEKEEAFQQQTRITLDNLFSQMQDGEMKELRIIVKADVNGSVEAVRQSLEKLSNEEVRVHIIHGAVGGINESDVMLANASNAIIVGFNVRPDPQAAENAERQGVDMRLYRIIYDCIEEISSAMKGMLAPKTRVVDIGRSEVRQVIHISSVGTIAGCYVVSGHIERRAMIRVVRDNIVIAEDQIKSLRRFKDDVREVQQGYECGIGLEKFNDIKEGDFLEAFIIEEYRD
ncbi:MAG: translation initiation factor IF-2, partial [Ruminococcaceae bacterium]|nr:translation initiation factor IF-2 [Oscillospiraceae bacterium]